MNRESASVYLHFKELEDLLELAKEVAESHEEPEEDEMVGVELTRRDVITIAEALDYLARALDEANFPCGAVDELAEKIGILIAETEE